MLIDRPHRAAFGIFTRTAVEAMPENTPARAVRAHYRQNLGREQNAGRRTAYGAKALARPQDGISAPQQQGRPEQRVRGPGRSLIVAIAFVSLGMVTIALRVPLVRAIPGSSIIFASIGLPVNLLGLEMRHVTSKLMGQGTARLLAIEGEVANITPTSVIVPVLHLSVRDVSGIEIYNWTTQPPKASLAAGETMPFRARLASPPARAHDVVVRLVPDGAINKEIQQ